MENVNYFFVLIAALANVAIGALWYSSYLFGKQWMRLSSVDSNNELQMGKMKDGAVGAYLASFLSAFVIGSVLAYILYRLDINTIKGGIISGFMLWIGFVATTSLTNTMFTEKPKKLWLIDTGFHAVAFMAMGAILVMFY